MEASRPWCLADNSTPSQTRSRIECLVKHFLDSLVAHEPAIEPLSMVCRTSRNTEAHDRFFGQGCIYLSDAVYDKSFTRKNGENSYCRVWKLLELCYKLLGLGKDVTQRELFYMLLTDAAAKVESQAQVNESIQDVVALLRCDRRSLGILASSKGSVVGRLVIEEAGGDIVDCSRLGSSAHVISGDLNLQQKFQSDARYILVVEKDAIFQRLVEDRFFQSVPSIIITAKGYPDLASRALLHRLHKEFPSLPIVALVDWNPGGLAILCTFKFGSIRMGLEAPKYVCDVKWLGLRQRDIQTYVPKEAFVNLEDRDRTLANSLLTSKMLKNQEEYKGEILEMLVSGQKAEIEALYAHGYNFLTRFITQKLVQRDYI
ncbi:hypothetical protein CY35_11G062900 [Sphagnum magellanicum]|nr:hypothetical protein CY35_11G062900 [Sphagnum magellanicum]